MQSWQDFRMLKQAYTQNELNNIVYICLKYAFGRKISCLDNPPNSDIYMIVLEIGDDTELENITKQITKFVKMKFLEETDDLSDYERFIHFLIDEFNQLPEKIKNDLGDDVDAEEFITKH